MPQDLHNFDSLSALVALLQYAPITTDLYVSRTNSSWSFTVIISSSRDSSCSRRRILFAKIRSLPALKMICKRLVILLAKIQLEPPCVDWENPHTCLTFLRNTPITFECRWLPWALLSICPLVHYAHMRLPNSKDTLGRQQTGFSTEDIHPAAETSSQCGRDNIPQNPSTQALACSPESSTQVH